MAFINERQANKQAKNTLEKSQNYSRIPLTNDDNYIIMANMTNNDNVTFERFTMKNALDITFGLIALLPIIALFVL